LAIFILSSLYFLSLLKKLHYYQSSALLVVDEIRCLPLGIKASNIVIIHRGKIFDRITG